MIETFTVPGSTKEGLLSSSRLAEQARAQTVDTFTKVYAFPALFVVDVTVGSPDAEPAAQAGNQLMTMLRSDATALRYLHQVAFLVKRPGNRFPQFVSVGRAANNDIVFALDSVSKFHAYFTRQGTGWAITDYRSTYGTHLNGGRIEANQPTPVKDGDLLSLGGHIGVVFLEAASLYAKLKSESSPTP